jgi:glutamate synthase (ferredoxin)
MCKATFKAIKKDNIIILSDRGVSDKMAIPMLLACSYVHHSMNILKCVRNLGSSLSPPNREPHHFALLFGYGASAINHTWNEIIRDQVDKSFITGMTADYAITNYNKAIAKGIENYE